jgi:hypothetical protein
VKPDTLQNAAWFLNVSDKPLAEQLLRQGKAKFDGDIWSVRLGALYAQAVVGSDRFTLGNVINSTSFEEASSAHAQRVRATLDASTDSILLAAAGRYLTMNAGQARVDFDHRALGRRYLERALQIDPSTAGPSLNWLDATETIRKEEEPLRGKPPESRPGVIAALPEDERLPVLARHAANEYMRAEYDDWRTTHPQLPGDERPERIEENRALAAASWQRSKAYAEEARALAEKRPDHPDYSDALFGATVALGANAIREGDREGAVRYMLAAAGAPPSRAPWGEWATRGTLETRLIGALLKAGERDTIIEYFERAATQRPADRQRLLAAAQSIRSGWLPSDYERR